MSNLEAYKNQGEGSQTLETMECAENINAWIADLFKPYLGARNLELGAGIGTISQYLISRAKIDFCENSAYCTEKLKSRFGEMKNEFYSDFFQMNPESIYNCIYSSNVLEHFENDQAVMEKAYQLLVPGGYFVAYVPAMQNLYSSFDQSIGHYRRYSDDDIGRLQNAFKEKQLKYKLVKKKYYHPVGALLWFIKMKLLGSKKVDVASAKSYDRLFPYLLWTNSFSKFVKGQNMLFAFQKGDNE